MKGLIVFVVFFAVVHAVPVMQGQSQESMQYFLYEDEKGNTHVEDLTIPPKNLTVSQADVTYYFHSISDPSGVLIHYNAVSAISKTSFNANKETLFIIHGWQNSHSSEVNSQIRGTALRNYDINIFVVDWSEISGLEYSAAQRAIPQVGGYIATFVKSLQKSFKLNLDRTRCVGHSLGAHVCGRTGASLGGQLRQIVGLDPAGPLFSLNNKNNRLDSSNAKFVQVIHTDGAKFGFFDQLGHADYYPNGGKTQAGCGIDATACSHGRSYIYYAESLNSNRFVARQCGSMNDYKNGKCKNGQRSSMGQFNVDTGAHGKFFLETNSKAPFSKG